MYGTDWTLFRLDRRRNETDRGENDSAIVQFETFSRRSHPGGLKSNFSTLLLTRCGKLRIECIQRHRAAVLIQTSCDNTIHYYHRTQLQKVLLQRKCH